MLKIVGHFLRLTDPDSPFQQQPPAARTHAQLRAEVWAAAAAEVESKHWEGILYEPSDDVRVRWMLEWCDVIAGTKPRVDDRLVSSLEFLLQRGKPLCPLTGKDRAAGAHLEEPEPLAQGS